MQYVQNANLIILGVFKKDRLTLVADLDLRKTRRKLLIWKPYDTDYHREGLYLLLQYTKTPQMKKKAFTRWLRHIHLLDAIIPDKNKCITNCPGNSNCAIVWGACGSVWTRGFAGNRQFFVVVVVAVRAYHCWLCVTWWLPIAGREKPFRTIVKLNIK